MAFEWLLPLLVGAIASAVSYDLLNAYLKKGHLHHLLWAAGMVLWAISAFAQMYALIFGWPILLYKLYYFSAISLAGFLGAGTLALVSSRKTIISLYAWFNVLAAAMLAISLAFAPVDLNVLKNLVVGGLALPSSVRMLAPVINIPGGITFIGGALYSYMKWRKPYTILIALGAAVPAIGGILARFAIPELLPYTDFLGIIFLSTGFYLSSKIKKRA